jgi:hypothetical protein
VNCAESVQQLGLQILHQLQSLLGLMMSLMLLLLLPHIDLPLAHDAHQVYGIMTYTCHEFPAEKCHVERVCVHQEKIHVLWKNTFHD